MSYRPFWQFYKSCFLFNFGISLLSTVLFGFGWGLFALVVISPLVAQLLFGIIRKNEFIFYHNLGITKQQLLIKNYVINAVLAIPLGIILFLIAIISAGFRVT